MCEDPFHFRHGFYFLWPKFSEFPFSLANDHMGSDHFPIQISVDKQPKRNIALTEKRYKLGKIDNDLFHKTHTGQSEHH